MQRIDLVGRKFGKLTVLKYSKTVKNSAYWNCQCECGNLSTVTARKLLAESTRSCGCLKVGPLRLAKGIASLNSLYRKTIKNAANRKKDFDLTVEQFSFLTSSTCFYCGQEPKAKHKLQVKNVEHGTYVYNGIDRIDSEKGYTFANCVGCCSRCNFAKNTMSVFEFLLHVERISVYRKEYLNRYKEIMSAVMKPKVVKELEEKMKEISSDEALMLLRPLVEEVLNKGGYAPGQLSLFVRDIEDTHIKKRLMS